MSELNTMPSSESTRQPLHTRQVTCTGYLRDDGLIDIDGYLLDTKHHDHDAHYKVIAAGTPVHQMHLRLTTDLQFVIHDVHAQTLDAPTPSCPQITEAYKRLIGLKVGPGFKKQVALRVGGTQGCTHLTELLGPMATTLYQSTFDLIWDAERKRAASELGYVMPRPWVIGTCHVYHPEGEAVRNRWPDDAQTPVKVIDPTV